MRPRDARVAGAAAGAFARVIALAISSASVFAPASGAVATVAAAASPPQADAALHRYSAPVTVERGGAFVQLPLPASAYGRSQQPGLHDLRLVDADFEPVPFGLLAPRREARTSELLRSAMLYPLPARPAPGGVWLSPIELTLQGERVSVRRSAGPAGAATTAAADPQQRSAGWLIDLGEPGPRRPAPQSLRLAWSGPAEFSAAYSLESSDDLRAWRPGGDGQVMALAQADRAAAPLTQPLVALPAGSGRFVRLVWSDAAAAPRLTGATVIAATSADVALDPPTELVLAPSAEPPSGTGTTTRIGTGTSPDTSDAGLARALHFDLGGVLPVVELDLRLAPAGTRVAPVRLQGRSRDGDAWRDLASTVFYRLERGDTVSTSPPLALGLSTTGSSAGAAETLRFVRLIPDPRAASLDPAATRLVVKAQLAGIVFAAQGRPPYTLLAGSATAAPGALPLAALVPALDDERPRFGRARLGDWTEVAAVARRIESEQRQAALRPWLLWAVLLAGVAGLGLMVWRLARGGSAPV